MYRTSVFVFCSVIYFGGCSPTSRTTKPTDGSFVSAGEQNLPTLSPTVSIKNKSPFTIPFVFANPTKKQISVAVRGRQNLELVFIQSTLFRNGKEFVPEISYDKMPLTKDHVIKLAPNETVLCYCDLPFVKLDVGKYELRLSYEIPAKSVLETDFGLTVLKLEQTIFLDVTE
jgi:hypothetical protein